MAPSVSQLVDVFRGFDKTGEGKIASSVLAGVLKELVEAAKDDVDVDSLLGAFGVSVGDPVNYRDFVSWLGIESGAGVSIACQAAFDGDVDTLRKINAAQGRATFMQVGLVKSQQKVAGLVYIGGHHAIHLQGFTEGLPHPQPANALQFAAFAGRAQSSEFLMQECMMAKDDDGAFGFSPTYIANCHRLGIDDAVIVDDAEFTRLFEDTEDLQINIGMRDQLSSILGEKLLTNGGNEILVSNAFAGKSACILYFSAHWCPPCRGFTPEFAAAYKEYLKTGSPEAEVVFISRDKDTSSFHKYFADMPWLAVPFDGTEALREKLSTNFSVRGIPTLVALGTDGVRFPDCDPPVDLRSAVMQHKCVAFPMTPTHLATLAEKQKEIAAATLKDLITGGLLLSLRAPGVEYLSASAVDAFAKYDHVVLLFSDGDLSDGSYPCIARVQKEVNENDSTRLGVIYLGWTLYNSECDHAAVYKLYEDTFFGLLEVSDEVKARLPKICSKAVGAPQCLVLTRSGEGSMSVVHENACGVIQEFGSKGYPWSADRIDELRAAENLRIDELKRLQANLQFLKGEDGRDGLFTNDGTELKVDALASSGPDAVVGIYFSAHWCPPCRGFTPQLAKCYLELKNGGKPFEVVFVSSDKSQDAYKEYIDEMPWVAVPYSERDLSKYLNKMFEVRGIPSLILLNADGTLITEDGRSAVQYGPEYFPWGPDEMKKGQDDAAQRAEEKKKAAVEAEKQAIEAQTKKGGPVLKRLRGTPGTALTHDMGQRTVKFHEFATIGTPDVVMKSGIVYFEVEVCHTNGVPQIGFALSGFTTCDCTTSDGVGDDALSWGLDGTRQLAWFDGSRPWDCKWEGGDVLGFAANVDAGKIAVSKNGEWSGVSLGVVFENELIKSGVYPCLTACQDYTVRYNLDGVVHGPYKYGPPPSTVWSSGYESGPHPLVEPS